MILCMTGMPGSGKSTAAAMLRDKGFKVLEMSDFASELMKKEHREINMKSMAEFTIEKRRELGKEIFARLTAEKIPKLGAKIVVNGVRNTEEITYLKKKFGSNLLVIAIVAPPKLRYKRLLERKGRGMSYRDFLWRERNERTKGIGKVINSADVIVANTGAKARLRSDINRVIKIATYKIRPSRKPVGGS